MILHPNNTSSPAHPKNILQKRALNSHHRQHDRTWHHSPFLHCGDHCSNYRSSDVVAVKITNGEPDCSAEYFAYASGKLEYFAGVCIEYFCFTFMRCIDHLLPFLYSFQPTDPPTSSPSKSPTTSPVTSPPTGSPTANPSTSVSCCESSPVLSLSFCSYHISCAMQLSLSRLPTQQRIPRF